MPILAFIKTEVKDQHGKRISYHKQPSRSFVRGFNHMLCSQMRAESAPAPAIQTKDTGGALRSLRNSPNCFTADSPIGTVTYGIRVGTGVAAVDIEDFALNTPIAEGAGASQLNHLATTCTWVGVAGNQCSFTVQRQLNNNSGGDITIEEAGIYNSYYMVGLAVIYIMGCRDLVSELIPNGGNITVTYTIRVVL